MENIVRFNEVDLITEESGELSGLLSIVPPPDFKLTLGEEESGALSGMGFLLGAGTWARQRKAMGKDPSRPASPEAKAGEEPCIPGPVVSDALLVLEVYEWSLKHRRILASLRMLDKISLRTLPALDS